MMSDDIRPGSDVSTTGRFGDGLGLGLGLHLGLGLGLGVRARVRVRGTVAELASPNCPRPNSFLL